MKTSALRRCSAADILRILLPLVCFSIFTTSKLPGQVQEWEWVNTPYGGTPHRINILHNGDILASTHLGLFRSNNQGELWKFQNGRSRFVRVHDLVQYRDSQYLFAATNGGLLQSDDNGQTWEWTAFDALVSTAIYDVKIDLRNNRIYTSADNVLYYSDDLGTSWETVNDFHSPFTFVVHPPTGHLLVWYDGKLYRLTDSGDNWKRLLSYPSPPYEAQQWEATPQGNILVSESQRIIQSTDIGDTWTTLFSVPNDTTYITFFHSDERGWLYAETMTRTDSQVVRHLYLSNDAGESWHQTGRPAFSGVVASVASYNDTILFAAWNLADPTDSAAVLQTGMHRSTDAGKTWQRYSNGISAMPVRSLHISPQDDLYVSDTAARLFQSTDNGTTWKEMMLPFQQQFGSSIPMAFASDGSIYAGIYGRGVARSTDNGETWLDVLHETPDPYGLSVLQLLALGDTVYMMSVKGVYATYDQGGTWTLLKGSGTFTYPYARHMLDNTLYVTAGNNGPYTYNIYHYDQDESIAPTRLNEIQLDLGAADLLTTTSGSLLVATQRGLHIWQPDSPFYLVDSSILYNTNTKKFARTPSGAILLSTSEGLMVSSNEGMSWELWDTYLVLGSTQFGIDSTGKVYAAPSWQGLFRSRSIVSGVESPPSTSTSMTNRTDAFPNPFTESVLIPFRLQYPGSVTVHIFNMGGQSVDVLTGTYSEAGNRSMVWHPGQLPSGLYFYRIETEKDVVTGTLHYTPSGM